MATQWNFTSEEIEARKVRSIDLAISGYPMPVFTDVMRCITAPPRGVLEVFIHPSNHRNLIVHIAGPEGSLYANGIFSLKMILPEDYPARPPKIFFVTRIYHPAVSPDGYLGMELLDLWPQGTTLNIVLAQILRKMDSVDLIYPLNLSVAMKWLENPEATAEETKLWVQQYATHPYPFNN